MRRPVRGWLALAACLLATAAAGCSTSAQSAASNNASHSTPVPAIATYVGPLEPTPPRTVPPIPNGIYRTEITESDLAAAGFADGGQPGISTLTLKNGTYILGCFANPGTDCGGTPPGPERNYVEVGYVRGDGNTVWFIQNDALKSKLTGCNLTLSPDDSASCGPDGSYRFTWKLTSKGLSMKGFYGTGDLVGQADGYFNYTCKPWRKIA